MGKRGVKTDLRRESPDVRNKFLIRPPTTYLQPVCIAKESMQHVFLSGERGGPSASGGWWKVECCMLGYRKACCCTFDSYSSLKQIIRPQEWLCHSRLRMVQSLQITGMKQNVLFLQRASMRKLIKGKHEKRCSFLERKGDRRSRWIVDSTLFE